ncbi:MAG: AAA family ATPase [Phycisphaerales bacterium]|nr:AAA family ATPase [Phycisphaerales bacterium]
MTNQQRLERLMLGRYPCISIVTQEETYALGLIREVVLRSPYHLKIWSMNGGIRDGLLADQPAIPETEHPAAALYYFCKHEGRIVNVMLDIGDHLKDGRVFRLLRDLIERCHDTGSQLVLVDHNDVFPAVIAASTTRFEISLPDEDELEQIVKETLRRLSQDEKIDIEISRRTYQTIIRNLSGLNRRQAEQIIVETVAEDRRFDAKDLHTVLARKRQLIHDGGLLEFVETPADLDAIGGMKRLKVWLKHRQNVFSEEAAKFGLQAPRGILLLGIQGAGKSYCAKAIATAWQRPLLRMDVGALYDRYIGESEKRLRDAFRQAEMMAPIILWIDEVEKAFASAASRSTDGGLSQRMFGALLTWMQEHESPVFLVATANDIEALPPELLRKGRFDEIFFVDLPSDTVRAEILAIHLRKRGRDPAGFDLKLLARKSEGFSGAELEQAIISSLHEAFATGTELDTDRIVKVIESSPPLSVTQAERIVTLQRWAKDRCVPADE